MQRNPAASGYSCMPFDVHEVERLVRSVRTLIEKADLWSRVGVSPQSIPDELRHVVQAMEPFGGVRNSGNSSRFGTAAANIEAYTDTRWITMQPTPPAYPF